jgi:hypothetical protein
MAEKDTEKMNISFKSEAPHGVDASEQGEKLDTGASTEVARTIENAATAEVTSESGEISEKQREDDKKQMSGGNGAKQQKKDISAEEVEAIRSKLLAQISKMGPQKAKRMMVSQIKAKLSTKERHLEKEYRKLSRMGHKAAYRLVQVVARLRKVREYFSKLADATFEVMKQLWLKIVHNV